MDIFTNLGINFVLLRKKLTDYPNDNIQIYILAGTELIFHQNIKFSPANMKVLSENHFLRKQEFYAISNVVMHPILG